MSATTFWHTLFYYVSLVPRENVAWEVETYSLQSVVVFCISLSLWLHKGIFAPDYWVNFSRWDLGIPFFLTLLTVCATSPHTPPIPPFPSSFQTYTLRSAFKLYFATLILSPMSLLHGSLMLLCTVPCMLWSLLSHFLACMLIGAHDCGLCSLWCLAQAWVFGKNWILTNRSCALQQRKKDGSSQLHEWQMREAVWCQYNHPVQRHVDHWVLDLSPLGQLQPHHTLYVAPQHAVGQIKKWLYISWLVHIFKKEPVRSSNLALTIYVLLP